MRTQIHPNTIRQLFFLALLVFMAIIIIKELYFMLGAFLGAVTLYVILLYPMKWLTVRYSVRPWIAALVLMMASFIIILLPVAYLVSTAIDILVPVFKNPDVLTRSFDQIHIFVLDNFGLDIFNPDNVSSITEQILPFTQKTVGGTFATLGNVALAYLVLYFLLVESRAIETWLRKTLPLKAANTKKFISEIRNLVYSNALGIPIVAFTQGLVACLGYYIFGVDEFVLMGILTAIASVIPILGTLVIYLPLAIFQFTTEGSFSGIGVAAWGFLIIGAVDNIARLLVQKKMADVHPLITLLGVFMGIPLFGFLGIIFGPLLLSIFFKLSKIYLDEFGKMDADHPDRIH